MVESKITIINSTGFHANNAAAFISFLNKFRCKVTIQKENNVINAKSILNLLILSLNKGDEVTLKVEGENENEVLKQILFYISNMKG